jgi:polyisoprenoid-binding protein YceI
MRKLFLTFVLALISITAFAQSAWSVDPMHSSINFNIKHMGISFVQGSLINLTEKFPQPEIIWKKERLILSYILLRSIQE